MNSANLLYLIAIAMLIAVEAKHHHKHSNKRKNNYSTNYYSRNPFVVIDRYGNCHTHDNQIRGHCIPSQYCQSAIQSWNIHRIYPISCYYTAYENTVCCPYEQVPSPIIPYMYQYHPNSVSSYNFEEKKQQSSERINERVCAENYLPRQKRGRRSVATPVQEDLIRKINRTDTQIVGGTHALKDQHSYMCALGWRSKASSDHSIKYHCGCVLIAPKFALTAAHCATLGGESPSIARLGGVDLDERHAEVIKVKSVTQHPNYDFELAYHDIAIVKLERNSKKIPACLWNIESLPKKELIALGYGQTKFAGAASNKLLQVTLNILNNQECSYHHKAEGSLQNGIGPGQICASAPNKDTCQGDSGGPLLMQWYKQSTLVPYVVGLTSLGEGCAGRLPGIYTRVSNYIDWIESTVWA